MVCPKPLTMWPGPGSQSSEAQDIQRADITPGVGKVQVIDSCWKHVGVSGTLSFTISVGDKLGSDCVP